MSSFIGCSFCPERFSSSSDLQQHLMICGNKTDQCPNCRQYIRRAVFTYHYENNCAQIDRDGTPKVSSTGSDQKALPKEKPFPKRMRCQYCQNEVFRNEYEVHKTHCVENPINRKKKESKQKGSESISAERKKMRSPDIAQVPCEFCDEPINFTEWAAHVKMCQDKENRRIADRAREISKESTTEQLPCEHCQKPFPSAQLERHQIICDKNPRYRSSVIRRQEPLISSDIKRYDRSSFHSSYDIPPQSRDSINRIDEQTKPETEERPSRRSLEDSDNRRSLTRSASLDRRVSTGPSSFQPPVALINSDHVSAYDNHDSISSTHHRPGGASSSSNHRKTQTETAQEPRPRRSSLGSSSRSTIPATQDSRGSTSLSKNATGHLPNKKTTSTFPTPSSEHTPRIMDKPRDSPKSKKTLSGIDSRPPWK